MHVAVPAEMIVTLECQSREDTHLEPHVPLVFGSSKVGGFRYITSRSLLKCLDTGNSVSIL